jgi:hypothetical protein
VPYCCDLYCNEQQQPVIYPFPGPGVGEFERLRLWEDFFVYEVIKKAKNEKLSFV